MRRLFVAALFCAACDGEILGGPPPASPAPAPVARPCAPGGSGRAAMARLTATQLLYALQDLLELPTPISAALPAELLSPAGYDGDGAFQTFSPELAGALLDVTDTALAAAARVPGSKVRACLPALEQSCVRAALSSFGHLAFRRELSAVELDAYAGLVSDTELAPALQAMLLSPHFVFHVLAEPAPDDPAERYRLSGAELATRLATFLWSSVPDARLLAAAESGALDTEEGVRAQVRRMLTDPRATRLGRDFTGQWLQIRRVADVTRAPSVIADFDDALRAAMQDETAALFNDTVARNAAPLTLFTAEHTFVDARLADFYGLDISGPFPLRLDLAGTPRQGVLTQASVLTVTSKPGRSSPVGRGVFLLSQALCAPPGSPPADANMNLEQGPAGEDLSGLSPGEQLTRVTSPERCQGCHARINPLGFAFEHFDAVGRFRTSDGSFPVDPANDARALIAGLDESALRACLTRNLLTFAVGRGLTAADSCTVDRLVKGADGRGLAELVADVAASAPFRAQEGQP